MPGINTALVTSFSDRQYEALERLHEVTASLSISSDAPPMDAGDVSLNAMIGVARGFYGVIPPRQKTPAPDANWESYTGALRNFNFSLTYSRAVAQLWRSACIDIAASTIVGGNEAVAQRALDIGFDWDDLQADVDAAATFEGLRLSHSLLAGSKDGESLVRTLFARSANKIRIDAPIEDVETAVKQAFDIEAANRKFLSPGKSRVLNVARYSVRAMRLDRPRPTTDNLAIISQFRRYVRRRLAPDTVQLHDHPLYPLAHDMLVQINHGLWENAARKPEIGEDPRAAFVDAVVITARTDDPDTRRQEFDRTVALRMQARQTIKGRTLPQPKPRKKR